MVVIPAYNEVVAAAKLLDRIADVKIWLSLVEYSVFVVDDGSTDSTASIMKRKKANASSTNQAWQESGFGTAIRDGFLECAKLCVSGDIIISLDADNTHTPSLIPEMLIKIQQGYDIVKASSYQNKSKTMGVPMLRQFMSYIASFKFRLLFPISGVKDYTCGYRAYLPGGGHEECF